MLSPLLENRAALYVSGVMGASERSNFELVLEFHQELRRHVAGLQQGLSTSVLSTLRPQDVPRAELKARILASAAARPLCREPESLVVTDQGGRIEWTNAAFTTMCGYTTDELIGRKPGHLLQGAGTDPHTVERIRGAVRERRACRETLLNYHKDGSPYLVDVRITPILDDEQEPLWFVAQERKLPDEVLLAG